MQERDLTWAWQGLNSGHKPFLRLSMAKPRTLYDKIWDDHLVHEAEDGTCLLYIDRHLVHEVTSPQAFEGLRLSGRTVRHPERTLAVVDHNVPTTDRSKGIAEEESRIQVETLAKNAKDFGVEYFHERDKRQGIVHVVGPNRASPCLAPQLSAATATLRRMARLEPSPTASALRKLSMSLPRKR